VYCPVGFGGLLGGARVAGPGRTGVAGVAPAGVVLARWNACTIQPAPPPDQPAAPAARPVIPDQPDLFPAAAERDRAGDPGWDRVGGGDQHAIEGFADRDSVLPGQP